MSLFGSFTDKEYVELLELNLVYPQLPRDDRSDITGVVNIKVIWTKMRSKGVIVHFRITYAPPRLSLYTNHCDNLFQFVRILLLGHQPLKESNCNVADVLHLEDRRNRSMLNHVILIELES